MYEQKRKFKIDIPVKLNVQSNFEKSIDFILKLIFQQFESLKTVMHIYLDTYWNNANIRQHCKWILISSEYLYNLSVS